MGLCVGAARLQPSMTQVTDGLDTKACHQQKSCHHQEMDVGIGCQCSANARVGRCAARYWIRPPRANTSVAVETVDLMSHVGLAMGVSRKGFAFERGRGRDLNNEPLCWPPCIPPCQTSAQCVVTRTPAWRHSKTEVARLNNRQPLVRRHLKEDLIGLDICVHGRFPAGYLTYIVGGCFYVRSNVIVQIA
jgi:hypothetical protein